MSNTFSGTQAPLKNQH